MDNERFDSVTRALGESSSRRQAIKLLLGGALGVAGLSAVTAASAEAKGTKKPKKPKKVEKVAICHRDEEGEFHKITVTKSAVQKHIDNHGDFLFAGCCENDDCPDGQTCTAGACAAPAPTP